MSRTEFEKAIERDKKREARKKLERDKDAARQFVNDVMNVELKPYGDTHNRSDDFSTREANYKEAEEFRKWNKLNRVVIENRRMQREIQVANKKIAKLQEDLEVYKRMLVSGESVRGLEKIVKDFRKRKEKDGCSKR